MSFESIIMVWLSLVFITSREQFVSGILQNVGFEGTGMPGLVCTRELTFSLNFYEKLKCWWESVWNHAVFGNLCMHINSLELIPMTYSFSAHGKAVQEVAQALMIELNIAIASISQKKNNNKCVTFPHSLNSSSLKTKPHHHVCLLSVCAYKLPRLHYATFRFFFFSSLLRFWLSSWHYKPL